MKDLKAIANLQSQVKQVRMEVKLGKQGFFEQITKTFKDKSWKLLDKIKSTTRTIEEMNQSIVALRAWELMNKNRVIDTSSILPLGTIVVRQTKNPFRLYDAPDEDKWNDYKMKWEKTSMYDQKIVVEKDGNYLRLKADVLKMITAYSFNTTDSPDTKLISHFLAEMLFDTSTWGKSVRVRNFKKNFFSKKELDLHLGYKDQKVFLRVFFLPEYR